MRCVYCGIETEAGTSFTFFYGKHARTSNGNNGSSSATATAETVLSPEEIFLCFSCQIASRHRAFRQQAFVSVAAIILLPAIVGLVLFPSFFPAWSDLGTFLLAVPVVGGIVVVGSLLSLGILARAVTDALGGCVWILCTWRKPYTLSGADPQLDKTAEGEAFAIRIRRTELQQQGYDEFWTREAVSMRKNTAWVFTLTRLSLGSVGLIAWGLGALVVLALGGYLTGVLR
jgi:uncharacterized membrane protein (DUF485 family)